ncbi:MAG: hypothetical protein FWE64_04665 [Alphaproteobacteria bacterium]|nr:hypothetical protein [Alphaproteobacteria bacterium]
MSKILETLNARKKQKFATGRGTAIHKKLQHAPPGLPELAQFFDKNSRAEVPIAGNIGGKFISRRIDRLCVTKDAAEFLDYKTDTDKNARRAAYTAQMREYSALISMIYPGRKVSGYILWLHDWTLEKFV